MPPFAPDAFTRDTLILESGQCCVSFVVLIVQRSDSRSNRWPTPGRRLSVTQISAEGQSSIDNVPSNIRKQSQQKGPDYVDELREASQIRINPRGDERERSQHEESTRPHCSKNTFRKPTRDHRHPMSPKQGNQSENQQGVPDHHLCSHQNRASPSAFRWAKRSLSRPVRRISHSAASTSGSRAPILPGSGAHRRTGPIHPLRRPNVPPRTAVSTKLLSRRSVVGQGRMRSPPRDGSRRPLMGWIRRVGRPGLRRHPGHGSARGSRSSSSVRLGGRRAPGSCRCHNHLRGDGWRSCGAGGGCGGLFDAGPEHGPGERLLHRWWMKVVSAPPATLLSVGADRREDPLCHCHFRPARGYLPSRRTGSSTQAGSRTSSRCQSQHHGWAPGA